jgi:hypothetical protein
MLDHKSMDGDVVERADPREVQADDFHSRRVIGYVTGRTTCAQMRTACARQCSPLAA